MARGREKVAVQTAPVEGPWELPEGWRWADLGRLLGGRSKSVTPSKFPNEVFELYSVPSFDSRSPEVLTGAEIGSSKQTVSQGDVLLCKINPRINRAWVVDSPRGYPQIASTEWIRFARREDIDPHFLCHYLSTEAVRSYLAMNASGVGGSLMRVKAATLDGFPIPVPPLETQRRIVARIDELFSELDDGETALARAREDLEIYRKALLKAAVTGELTADWRAANPCTETGEQLLKRILAERRARWEADPKNKGKRYKEPTAPDTSGLPELPEGWAWVAWGQVGVSQNGRPFPSSAYCDDGVKLLRPGNLFADGSVRWPLKNTRCLPVSYLEDNIDLVVWGRELVMNLTAQSLKDDFLGRICMTEVIEKCLLNQRLARLTPIGVEREYVFRVFQSPLFREFVAHLNTGSMIQHIYTSQIEHFKFPLPPETEQIEICQRLREALLNYNDLVSLVEGSQPISSLRQSILAAAFKGELVQ